METNGNGRDDAGRFAAGHAGGPGRPKGYAAVARKILRETRDGDELVEHALATWRDEAQDADRRWQAFTWLADRAIGKAVAPSVVDVHATTTSTGPAIDWSRVPISTRVSILAAIRAARGDTGVTPELPAGESSTEIER